MAVLVLLALGASACEGPPERVVGSEVTPAPMETTPVATEAPITTTEAPSTVGGPAVIEPPATPSTTVPALLGLATELVAEGLAFPVSMEPVPGRDAFVIVTKAGRIHLVAGRDTSVWLDITDRVRDRGEQGLFAVAFAPDFPTSGRLFVHYSDRAGDTTVSELREEGGLVDPTGEVVLFTADQPASNHNGGALEVAPDGTLLVALGDGGGSGDRYGNGQRTDTPLGAILRFDVSSPGVAVPAPGNPIIDGGAPGLWAFGLRNPWRMTIDAGRLFVADVGQNRFEEINVVPWDRAGVNFGWPITEGYHCFDPPSGCSAEGLTLPVVEIAHGDEGTCSVTGGVVARGAMIPELHGHYLFSDYCGGYLRSLGPDGTVVSWTELLDVPLGRVTAFGFDAAGEVLIASADGRVVRLVPRR